MTARPTFELSPQDARERGIADGDLCRLYNDRGETFGYALVVEGLLPGVVGAPKQLQGSKMRNGANLNALTSQEVADMGGGPVFYSTLAQLVKVTDPATVATDAAVSAPSAHAR
jgi:anaerobic selenocysteine-containing dehydrogenase